MSNERILVVDQGFAFQVLFSTWSLVVLVMGGYVKWVIISHMMSSGKIKSINGMIIIDQLLNYGNGLILLAQVFFVLKLHMSGAPNVIESVFCSAIDKLAVFSLMYGHYGGAGIAFFRTTFFVCPRVVRFWVGEKQFCGLILIPAFIACSVLAFFLSENPVYEHNYHYQLCIGQYARLASEDNSKSFARLLRVRSVQIVMIMNLIEFFCYLTFFLIMYKHHGSTAKVLSASMKDQMAHRKRQHTLTFSSHISSWLIKVLVIVVLSLGKYANEGYRHISIEISQLSAPMIDFTILPLIQVISSQDFRHKFISSWPNVFK
ncbi:uncharacterized protein LOC131887888 [Tigriopus californicus]|uniref:uncharacterized protein LOC131887888 n=1 Tax=Tigriopus californicus TaxID=6832 RepID=UPI0027DA1870|nr:uncharacterized protein LOC131887888 [Tigriopus californicus]